MKVWLISDIDVASATFLAKFHVSWPSDTRFPRRTVVFVGFAANAMANAENVQCDAACKV